MQPITSKQNITDNSKSGTTSALDSNYNKNLPSQKYFTNQELNNLTKVGKGPLPPTLKPRPPSGARK